MPAKSRIVWTTQEKNAVLTAARKLRERQPSSTLAQVGNRAQGTLPKQRRRPVNNKLTSWLSTSLKGGSPIAGAARARRSPGQRLPQRRAPNVRKRSKQYPRRGPTCCRR